MIGVLNDSWGYNEKFRCKLDFSTYQSDGYTISINAIDDSVASIINANKSQVYDIPVSELKEDTLYYDRIYLNNNTKWSINPNVDQTQDDVYEVIINTKDIYTLLPITYIDTNFAVKNIIDVSDQILSIHEATGDNYMIKGITPHPIKIRISFSIKAGKTSEEIVLALFLLY